MSAHIRVRNVSLEVPLYLQSDRSAKSWLQTLLGAATARPHREFLTILKDVSFDVEEGDRLALIGRNGAGKSTLLRVLTEAFLPTVGTVDVSGTRQALLNISLGFNAQATVMENIYLRGTAMGIHTSQLRSLVHPILDFSGLQELAQRRLHTLSSGQKMRLGFAIATSVEQDIILMDEWLGAGDAEFLKQARERMDDRVRGSKIIVLASHNNGLLKRICNKGMVMDKGRVTFFGPIDEALEMYKGMVTPAKAGAKAAAV
jgi:lipopolysaccharide transport system ATP-binding protein